MTKNEPILAIDIPEIDKIERDPIQQDGEITKDPIIEDRAIIENPEIIAQGDISGEKIDNISQIDGRIDWIPQIPTRS